MKAVPKLSKPPSRRRFRVLGAAAASVLMVAGTAVPGSAAVITTPDPLPVAEAIAAPTTPITGAQFVTIPPLGTPVGIGDSPLAGFPTNGSTYAVLSTGDAGLADQPEQPGVFPSVDNGGGNVRGNTDLDVTILRIDFNVPGVLNCVRFDFKFLSEEFPDFVGSSVNDAFIAELDHSTWTTSGSVINAPNNFAFDPTGQPISINTTGATSMTPAFAAGTPYGGATPALSAATLVTPGPHSLYLSIFDQGDHIYDSAVFVDNLALSFASTADQCHQGSEVKAFNLDLSPATAINQVGGAHTVTATVINEETGAPVPNGSILISVTGANPTNTTITTNASGQATFTYTGTASGEDVITGCFDVNGSGTCDEGEPLVSALKTWELAPPILTLTPPAATNNVGAAHAVTAHLTGNGGTPINGGRILFTVHGANERTGTATTDGTGSAGFSYQGTGDGTDQITACYDANVNGVCDIDETTAMATKTWLVPDPTLSLTPSAATNPVGSEHTLTATLTAAAGTVRVGGGRVLFTVTGANPQTGEAFTDASGQARFLYRGVVAGTDTITACFDANANDVCDPGEVTTTATKTWAATGLSLDPGTATNTVGGSHTVTATLRESASGTPVGGASVIFTVTGANSASETATTSGSGTATLTYRGTATGTDTITACQDANADRRCDPGEATATKTWLAAPGPSPSPTPGPVLPETGSRLTPLIATGAALILLGAAALIALALIRRQRRNVTGE